MSLQNKYLQSHEQYKAHKNYQQKMIPSQAIFQAKNQQIFTPANILRNTQYLSHLQSYLNIKRPYTQAQFGYLFEAIDPGALCKIIVQGIYLLQICYLFKIKVYLSLNLYTDKGKYIPSTPSLNIFQLYCFENQLIQKNDGLKIKLTVLDNQFVKVFDDDKNRIQDFFLVLNFMSKHIRQYLNCIQKTQIQSSANSELSQNRRFLSQFLITYEKIVLVQKSRIKEPKFLIKFLQQTKLFRAHSMLVKIINKTLFYSIKLFTRHLLEQLKFSLSQIGKYFMYQIKEAKFQKQVAKIIDNFFSKLCMLNVIEITKSLKGVNEEQQQANKDFLSLFDYEAVLQTQLPTITAIIVVPQQKCLKMSPQLFKNLISSTSLQNLEVDKEMVPLKNVEIQISYTYASNDIHINCITDVDLVVDNMDYLNYLIASFNEGMKSTLIVDSIEKFRRPMTKKVQKVIAFRLKYKGKSNEEPLTKILELIDMGILASNIFMNKLSKKSFIKLQEYEKREKICQTFRHYQNILRNLMRKFYGQLKTEN